MILQSIAKLFAMNERTWQRHANPWSVWTRVVTMPLLVLAIWSRVWLGWWAVVPIALLLVWVWLNPRVFAQPTTTKSWASKAVLGERLWLQRHKLTLPDQHRWAPHILTMTAIIGSIVLLWGLIVLNIWLTLLGFTIAQISKLWFLDRMVWLFEDTKNQ